MEGDFNREVLRLDCKSSVSRITERIRDLVFRKLRKKGVVIGLSGGIDSSVSAALCVEALGKENVFGIFMPDQDSGPETLPLSKLIADHLGIESTLEDITSILEAAGCYTRRDGAIEEVIPEYTEEWKMKIVLPSILNSDILRVFFLVARSPDGVEKRVRLKQKTYLKILSAMNFKQRTRKMLEYYHADRLNFADIGTDNRLEYDQGFFVKNGDGSADLRPISHLYKTQVYQLADHLSLPERIRKTSPTTDTYSLPQSQEEFYFSLPYDLLDLCLYGLNNGVALSEVARETGLEPDQVDRVFRDINNKRKATKYLHMKPLLIEDVPEILDE